MREVKATSEKLAEAMKELDDHGTYDKFRLLTLSSEEAVDILRNDPSMASRLVFVKKMPADALDYLARNFDEKIKLRIALKYPLLDQTYEYLASQSDVIKLRIYFNKKVPNFIKEKIRGEASAFVRSEIERWEEVIKTRQNQ